MNRISRHPLVGILPVVLSLLVLMMMIQMLLFGCTPERPKLLPTSTTTSVGTTTTTTTTVTAAAAAYVIVPPIFHSISSGTLIKQKRRRLDSWRYYSRSIQRVAVSAYTTTTTTTTTTTSSLRLSDHTDPATAVIDNKSYDTTSPISDSTTTTTTIHDSYWNLDQLLSYATEEGIVLSISKVGPLIRTVARAEHNKTILLGYVEGFVRPKSIIPSAAVVFGSSFSSNQILHLDKMEVFSSMVTRARMQQQQQQQQEQQQQNENGNNNNNNVEEDTTNTTFSSSTANTKFRNGGTILGIGLLLGYYCVLDYVMNHQGNLSSSSSSSLSSSSTVLPPTSSSSSLVTEFLAIDDEYYQHERLVRYYTLAGFDIIKYVGDTPQDIPDRLIWGGCGTLLRQDCISLLYKWTKLMQRSQNKRRQQKEMRREQ